MENESLDFTFISNCLLACCFIHNYLMDEKDILLDPEFNEDDMEEIFIESSIPSESVEFAKN